MRTLFTICILAILSSGLQAQNEESKSDAVETANFFKPVKWRSIGPFRGGRSVTSCGVIGDPLTYYMGTTGGGLWKTEDAGQIWNNISDGYFKTGSVGAVSVADSDPNVVYCGMGEHAPRGVQTSHGDGMYKSIDAGKTWKHIGLEKTQHIARVVIHPKNPDIVYVAAQGALHGESEDRGIYKSTDGGKTWTNVLYVNDLTGCAELSMDLNHPHILYAAMWEHQRLPWKVVSGGPGSGLYKSTDGGESWEKIHNGLPEEKGKMAIAVCKSNSDRLYALIESDTKKEKGGLFVSSDAGEKWTRVSDDHRLVQRAWYYIEVFTDPNDEHTVYVMSAPALRSIDGGKTWERLTGTHGDFHNLWINPENSKNLCIANDGGAAISFNYGKTWSTQSNMPTAQFYRINVDNHFPYRIYGGQQDNSSVRIESRAVDGGGITAKNWTASAGGESAFLAFDPDDPRYVLGGSYLGTIEVLDTKVKAGTKVMAAPIQYLGMEARQMKYLYNWNAPIIWSQHESSTYYHGAQLLLRTRDMGVTWDEVSPDLTRNQDDKQGAGGGPYTIEAVGAENYGTLSYVIESPHEAGVIWTGSDDGLVHITRDGCESWQNVTPTGLEECLVNAIDVSPHDAGTAYIATTRYKFNDKTPGLYKTSDYGKNWTNISDGIPEGAFTRVIREDQDRKGLLYAGTETGVYFSIDDGATWKSLQLNLPVTPITDLRVHRGDLIASTSGRSFWILDDLGMLAQYENSEEKFKIFRPQDTYLVNSRSELNSNSEKFKGTDPFNGINPATGAVMYYQLPKMEKTDVVTLEIHDANGQLVRSFSSIKDSTFLKYDGGPPEEPVLGKSVGLNRFVWDLRHPTMPGIPKAYIEGSYRGHKVSPGTYSLMVKAGAHESSIEFQVLPNPLYSTEPETYKEYDEAMLSMENTITEMHNMVNKLYTASKQIEAVIAGIPNESKYDDIRANGKKLLANLKAWDNDMVQRLSKAYDDVENYPNKFSANYLYLVNQTQSDLPRVNQSNKDMMEELNDQWATLKNRGETLIQDNLPTYNVQLWQSGIGPVWAAKKIKP